MAVALHKIKHEKRKSDSVHVLVSKTPKRRSKVTLGKQCRIWLKQLKSDSEHKVLWYCSVLRLFVSHIVLSCDAWYDSKERTIPEKNEKWAWLSYCLLLNASTMWTYNLKQTLQMRFCTCFLETHENRQGYARWYSVKWNMK